MEVMGQLKSTVLVLNKMFSDSKADTRLRQSDLMKSSGYLTVKLTLFFQSNERTITKKGFGTKSV